MRITSVYHLLLVILTFCPFLSYAQCNSPTSVNKVDVTTASCLANGKIAISGVQPVVTSPSKRQFALYDQAGGEVKTWQDDSTFINVAAGTYTAYIRTACSTGLSSNYQLSVTVNSTYDPISQFQAYSSPAVNCCNGFVDASALTQNNKKASQFALVSSLNADDLDPSSFVKPKQTASLFLSLCAGNYYIRAYDACGAYQTTNVTVNLQNVTPQLAVATLRRPSCDSLAISGQLNNAFQKYPVQSVEKSWITWPDNSVDTISLIRDPGWTSFYFKFPNRKLDPNYESNNPFVSSIHWPVTVKISYKDQCGMVTDLSKTFTNPGPFRVDQLEYNASRCDSVTYLPTFYYGSQTNPGISYIGSEARVSLDNGTTWQNIPLYYGQFILALKRGVTYQMKYAVCKDTISMNFSVPNLRNLQPYTTVLNATSCTGDLILYNQPTTPNIYVKLTSGPSSVNPLPDGVRSSNTTMVTFEKLPFGTYTYIMRDTVDGTCPRQFQGTVSFSQRPFEVKMEGKNREACNGKINLGFSPGGVKNSTVSNGRPITVKVITQPTGAGIPSSFTINNWQYDEVYPPQLRNMIPGDYSFRLVDSIGTDCPRSTTASIHVAPDNVLDLDFTFQPKCNGDVVFTSKGNEVTIRTDGTVYKNPFSFFWSIRLIDSTGATRTSNGSTVSSDLTTMKTSLQLLSIPNGTYKVQSYLLNNTDTCKVVEKTLFLGFRPITIPSSRLLGGCGGSGNAATLVAPAVGGSGTYMYSLFNGAASAENRIAGPQSSPIFNGLSSNITYNVLATDECGSGVQRTSSAAESSYPVGTSAQKFCPGDNMALSVSQISGATYQWKKDGVVLPGENSYKLTRTNVQPQTDNGAYTSDIILNSCTLASNTVNVIVNCAPLPVTLTRFEAKVQENAVALNWETTMESNFSGFNIERSTDAKTWNSIGFIATSSIKGNSKNNQTYTFRDSEILSETQYYRLKNLDLDGTYAYSQIRSVNLKGLDVEISAYPNPANQILTIDKLLPETMINLVNSNGKVVYQSSTSLGKEGKFTMDVSRIPVGVYLLSIRDKSGNQIVKKIAIAR